MKKNDTDRDRDRDRDMWQILYIPDKPPIPPNQQQPTGYFTLPIPPFIHTTLSLSLLLLFNTIHTFNLYLP